MRTLSERQKSISDISLILVNLHNEEIDDMMDSLCGLPTLPTVGQLCFPGNKMMQMMIDVLFDDESEWATLLECILKNQYLNPQGKITQRDKFDIAKLFNMREDDFRQVARTSKQGFIYVLSQIYSHPIFHNNSPRQQLPIPHQLALTLERFGLNGNGASVGLFSHNLNSRGTVIKVTHCVIEAILSLAKTYVSWPTAARRKEMSEVMKSEGFEGCVGFVDGTTLPLHQRPGIDGEVFYDRKKKYLINVQVICDCDKYITAFFSGWPGSCADSMVFQRMELMKNPDLYFDEAHYLVANSAYGLSKYTIPAYKAPAANLPINTEFNYCLAKSQVRNEHCIGILKGRWASLQQLRLQLYKKKHIIDFNQWIYSCVILHNMLAQLGDSWVDLCSPGGGSSMQPDPDNNNEQSDAESFRCHVKKQCIAINTQNGILPIVA